MYQYVNFAVSFPLKGDAKVQTHSQTCKHFGKNLCILNVCLLLRLYLYKF